MKKFGLFALLLGVALIMGCAQETKPVEKPKGDAVTAPADGATAPKTDEAKPADKPADKPAENK
ncbi:MAG: hypothetical protein ABFD16_04925 [Thermoguttaceae bacterium]|jgi:hypothetical protein